MFTLDQVVPWGRSFREYERMFALTGEDLRCRILGCGDGPAAFNAEATRRGACVVSCDPLYQFSGEQVRGRIAATRDEILEQTRRNQAAFVWDEIRDVEELGRVRMEAMDDFLADYEAGRAQGRYVEAALPDLPFPDGAFDLAVCSHLLFLYSDQLSGSFHRRAIVELCRVAGEVRIFPLLSLAGIPSPHLPAVQEAAARAGCATRVETVPYEFQRGANQMMRIERTGSARR
ncbi:MAG: hypothetical protein QM820_06490 [Minicystis sp.]